MKLIYAIIFIFILLFSGVAQAELWCKRDGGVTGHCSPLYKFKYIITDTGLKVSGELNMNSHGYYKLIVVIPTHTDDQKPEGYTDADVGNTIVRTYTIVGKSEAELNQDKAKDLDRYLFLLMKGQIAKSKLTLTDMPQELQDAYNAAVALGW